MTEGRINPALIQKNDLFTNLPENEIDFIISRSGSLNLKKGELLFSSGEKAKHFYILLSGAIRVFDSHSDGTQDEMAMYAAGDTIGDFDFARGAEYNACAEAAEDSSLIIFPDSGLSMESLALEEPRTVCSIFLNAIVMMTGRINSTRKLIMKDMTWVQELHRRAYEDSSTGLWKQTLINDEIIGVLNDPAALIMLKPDRFKILVDSRGHAAGDEAMVRIAIILKNMTRINGHGWPLRFKSNEVGVIINNCDANQAEIIAKGLAKAIETMEPVPEEGNIPEFNFSATISWAIWPHDETEWNSLFQNNYTLLMDTWRAGGNTIIHYSKTDKQDNENN